MLKIKPIARFKKDLKKFKHNSEVIKELNHVLSLLVQRKSLPVKYQDHHLSGHWKESRECHIKPDLLLIYRINLEDEILILERVGSHSELFN